MLLIWLLCYNQSRLHSTLNYVSLVQFEQPWLTKVVGYATSLIVQMDGDSPWHSHVEITGYGTFSTHDPSGQTL